MNSLCNTHLEPPVCYPERGCADVWLRHRHLSPFPRQDGSPNSLAKRHPLEVCTLSRRARRPRQIPEPVSAPLQDGIRFLQDPTPAPPWASLTISLPSPAGTILTQRGGKIGRLVKAKDTGRPGADLLVSASEVHSDLRYLQLDRGACRPRVDDVEPRLQLTLPFGPSLSATLACIALRSLYRFTSVYHSRLPNPIPVCGYQEDFPHGWSPAPRRLSALSRPLFIQDGRLTQRYGWFSRTSSSSHSPRRDSGRVTFSVDQIMVHWENNFFIMKRHRAAPTDCEMSDGPTIGN
jgi:hypothetical protein